MTSPRWTIDDLISYDFQSDEYKDLFARAEATVFQSPVWLDHVYKRLAAELGASASIITVRERENARLVALLPLVKRRYWTLDVAEFADFGVNDYCSLVADAELLPALIADRSISSGIRRLLATSDILVARKIPRPALPAFDLIGEARRSKLDFGAHDTQLFGPFEHWRETNISPSRRRFLDTKRKDLAKKGKIAIAVAETPAALADALARIRTFREYRFRATAMTDILGKDTFIRFYRDISGGAPLSRAYTLTVNDAPVSVAFGLVKDGTFHLVLTGFDFERYRNFSVGLLIIEEALRDCIARGMTKFDFTIGDQSYKRDFGTDTTEMWTMWQGLTLPGRALALAMSRSPRVQRWARRLAKRRLRR